MGGDGGRPSGVKDPVRSARNVLAFYRGRKTMKHLAGSVVAISGAGSGIGRALAQEFARRGARLSL